MKGFGAPGNSRRAAPRSPPCGSADSMFVTLAFLALLIEAIVGYPDWLVQAIGHPVTWMGRLIGMLENFLNRGGGGRASRGVWGGVSLLMVVGTTVVIACMLERGLFLLWLP